MNELVTLYETTRRRARRLPSWRLHRTACRARRDLTRDPLNEQHQVRLVAYEQELRARGVLSRPTFPVRPNQPPASFRRRLSIRARAWTGYLGSAPQ